VSAPSPVTGRKKFSTAKYAKYAKWFGIPFAYFAWFAVQLSGGICPCQPPPVFAKTAA